ncbi:hypothetical protein [Winogradskyella haliclonae]|uniref:Lipocalin-like domain-containing protein n=1 Tax=Winogradskyella haliclonae TaxID=2048558 RepID=A0ABQ2C2B0_9FLAO|nr:hypothetical protein [Winogradskyella haliclonae]GGI57927.1 hypothetical protein GCM10011444_22360 [Winogradskyella haliclonae]
MKSTLKTTLVLLAIFLNLSCRDENPLLGEWKLSSWYIDIEMDLNKDTIRTSNLLDEANCKNKEVLTIYANGTINAVNTYNPIVKISKKEDEYIFDVECNKGSVGFATTYKILDKKVIIEPNGEEYHFNGKQLTRIFKDAITIYNTDFTEAVETKDLVLNYIKN